MAKTSAKNIEFQTALTSALKLRAFGVQYSEIVEKVKNAKGESYWKSISACQKAVAKALSDDLSQTVEAARNKIVVRNERRILPLMEKFEANKSILVSKEIGRIDDSTAKLKGLYAPTKLAHEGKDGDAEIKTGVRVILPPEPNE